MSNAKVQRQNPKSETQPPPTESSIWRRLSVESYCTICDFIVHFENDVSCSSTHSGGVESRFCDSDSALLSCSLCLELILQLKPN